MNTSRAATLILAAGLFAGASFAQQQPAAPAKLAPPPQVVPPAATGATGAQEAPKDKTTIFQPLPAGTPSFTPLTKKGPDGKWMEIDGVVDARALVANPLVDDAARAKMKGVVEEWAADVNQLAIDNLDFLEKIDNEGLIEKMDFNDTSQVRYMAQILVPLTSAGPLTARLQNKNAVTTEQGSLNGIISNDYLEKIFQEVMGGNTVDPLRVDDAPEKQQEKIDRINRLTHFLYYTTCRDARESYHQILEDVAPMADQVLQSVDPSAASKAGAAIASAKSATTGAEKQKRVADLIKPLSFEQRRAFLQKAVEMGANKNPLEVAEKKMGGAN